MKKSYAIAAVFFIVLYAIASDKMPFSGVHTTYNEEYSNFNDAFSQRFKDKKEVWLVLGNRGAKNCYVERFSKNWIFWDDHSSSDNIGISGNFFDLKNWKQVSKLLPEKIDYIAVDFNDLVNHSKRNDILMASKNILKQEGMFCIEDVYNNRKKLFQHFSNEDFQQLAKDFDIEYIYWDGYISALPYTSDRSINKKSDMYKGLEKMILRLASGNAEDKKKILPYITPTLYDRSFLIPKDLIKKLIRDIIDSAEIRKIIANYETSLEEEKRIEESIKQKKEEIESIKKDIDNYTKMTSFSKSLSDKFSALSKNINAFAKGVNYLSSNQQNNNSLISKMSKFLNKQGNDSTQDLKDKLEEKKSKLREYERTLSELQTQINVVKTGIKDYADKILKHNDEVFADFEKDRFLQEYVSYKKTNLNDIIEDCKESNKDFWKSYDSFWNTISETEILAKELEKSWSPDILTRNTMSLHQLETNAEHRVNNTSRVVILFIKK